MATTTRSSSSRRLLVMAALLVACSRPPAIPDLNGTWGHQRVFAIDEVCSETLPDGSVRSVECAQSGSAETTADFPKYKPEMQPRVDDLRARQVSADTVLRCYPPGVPRIGPPAKIIQTATEITFLYDDPNGSFYRVIPIDGRPHRTGLSSSYLGDAVGRFEGDTLVVETVNFTDETWLTDNGAFHTKELKVTERLRRAGETIEYQPIAEDPAVLSEPWKLRPRVLRRSAQALEEPPRCEERDLDQMVDPSQFHENPR